MDMSSFQHTSQLAKGSCQQTIYEGHSHPITIQHYTSLLPHSFHSYLRTHGQLHLTLLADKQSANMPPDGESS